MRYSTHIWQEENNKPVFRFQTDDKDVHQHMLQSKEFEMVGWGVNVHLWIYRAKFSSIQDARKALNLKHGRNKNTVLFENGYRLPGRVLHLSGPDT